MKFSKAEIEDIPILRAALSDYCERVCDYSAGNLVFWRNYYKTEYYLADDGFALHFGSLGGKSCYWCSDNAELAEKIIEHEGGQATFACLTRKELTVLSEALEITEVHHSRDWDDYIYDSPDLCELSGRRYCGQRNHINKFNRLYPNAEFEEINSQNAEEVKRFCFDYFHKFGRDSAEVDSYEEKALYEQLDNIERYMQDTLLLRVNGNVVGFSVGEKVGDVLIVHTEKANTAYDGVYPVLLREFARRYAGKIAFINREEDCGEAGLRTSKLSYHPREILEKYSISAKKK